jgi:hypothetical protein
MNQSVPTPTVCSTNPDMNVTSAINILENQQDSLHNMLGTLDNFLYGTSITTLNQEEKCEGLEGRLNQLVDSNAKALNKLEFILSKL